MSKHWAKLIEDFQFSFTKSKINYLPGNNGRPFASSHAMHPIAQISTGFSYGQLLNDEKYHEIFCTNLI